MNWKETLVFPPEVPISERAKDLILRFVKKLMDCILKHILTVIVSDHAFMSVPKVYQW